VFLGNTKNFFDHAILSLIFQFVFLTSTYGQGTWSPLKTGAGGWITGMDMHPSGAPFYARSDVGGAYRYDESTANWEQIVISTSMPSDEVGPNKYEGVLSIVSAPSDECTIPGKSGECCLTANFFSRDVLVADPVLENTFYLYDFGNGGIHRTSDGGANWETFSELDNPYAFNGKMAVVQGEESHLFL